MLEVGKGPEMQLSRLNNVSPMGVVVRENFSFHPVANNLSHLLASQASEHILGAICVRTDIKFLARGKS